MALDKYRAKRNFKRTPEPRGKKSRSRGHALSYVIQKHAASHLHYDFRLELNGVLLSWAIPKGPSLDPADKRLAMHVEDHPIEYGGFEGVIPEHQYGAGTVMLWDRGTWRPKDDPVTGYASGRLKFELDGDKLHGGWTLVQTNGSKYGGKTGRQAWLLIKEKDEFARTAGKPIIDSAPNSVATGRSLDRIASARANVWESRLSAAQNVRAGAIGATRGKDARRSTADSAAAAATTPAAGKGMPPGARVAKLPALLKPMLATLVSAAPAGDDWVHEVKYDGYRLLCRIEKGNAHLFSRNGKDWTAPFAAIARDLARLPVRNAWIDGEAVVLDASGRSSFQALQNALSDASAQISFFAFDLIYCDGHDLRGVALEGRKGLLRQLVGEGVGSLRVGPEIRGSGDEFFRQACSLRLEGAVCKRAGSHYHDGTRTRDWVKVKCTRRQEMVIGGYTDPQGSRTGFGALLLGINENGMLRYAGKVGTGFDQHTLTALHQLLVKRAQVKPPFANPPRGFEAKGAHWVKPDLVAEIAFTEWSNDGALRHPSFVGLRRDKLAGEVVREESQMAPTTRKPPSAKRAGAARAPASDASSIEGIALSHADKLYFTGDRITKGEVASYYARIAPWILPHTRDRPLSLLRCPDGWQGQCFYQKHADKSVNAVVDRIQVPEGDGTAMYMGASSAAALVALVQWGVIEMHPWGSRRPRLDRPDRLIFDLDPDDAVSWKQLATSAGLLRTLLSELGFHTFLKTTGGKGLHVVVPIRATLDWGQAKGFTRAVADFLVRTFDDRFTATVSKARRKGKIFIDYLRNTEGATAIAPYAVRAREGAPVSMPIAWEELAVDVRFAHFNVRNAERTIADRRHDPWADFAAVRQAVTKAHGRKMGLEL